MLSLYLRQVPHCNAVSAHRKGLDVHRRASRVNLHAIWCLSSPSSDSIVNNLFIKICLPRGIRYLQLWLRLNYKLIPIHLSLHLKFP